MKKLLATLALTAAVVSCASVMAFAGDKEEYNLIRATDFSDFTLAAEAAVDEENGTFVLTTVTEDPKYAYSTAGFALDPAVMRKLSLTWSYKTEDVVRGENDWNAARFFVNFFDDSEQQVNDWPSPGYWKGTSDWKNGKWTLAIPKNAASAKISIGLDNATGTFRLKDLVIYALDKDNKMVEPIPW